ncbi:MAG: HIT domain-containing protein [Proteobacteria bacterium]|nr:HIT domain-containing protein [Pseudomonadota bacterium]MBU1709545.1 HIT domain-containing protein [Pseudomonadota bacterium]
MKPLWTPWRMEYVLGKEGQKECIFDCAAEQRHDKQNLMLYRDRTTVVLMNRFPYANGHLLVAPARHIADICDLAPEENASLMGLLQQAVSIIRKHLNPAGINIGLNLGKTAGAGIAAHLHFHIVPRWEGDHNFMAVLADLKTIPEHIENTFDKLLPDFRRLLEKSD